MTVNEGAKSAGGWFQRWWKAEGLFIAAIAVIAIITKPTEESFRDKLRAEVRTALSFETGSTNGDPLDVFVKAMCAVDPTAADACVTLILSNFRVGFRDLIVLKFAVLNDGAGRQDNYLGAFNNWWRVGGS